MSVLMQSSTIKPLVSVVDELLLDQVVLFHELALIQDYMENSLFLFRYLTFYLHFFVSM